MSEPSALVAFAPGRANLIGEHTDYNDGLALPFAIEQGVRVTRTTPATNPGAITATALDAGHAQETFDLSTSYRQDPRGDWTDYVRGAVAELQVAGHALSPTDLAITGNVPQGGGLSSSAALEAALTLALLGEEPAHLRNRIELARLCSRIENEWTGARTGLLDQLASLLGEEDHALRIDFQTLEITLVPMDLHGHQLIVVPSGETHTLAAGSGYEQRRAECEDAKQRLGLTTLRNATHEQANTLPDPLNKRVRYGLEENGRVNAAIEALALGDMNRLGALLDTSHAGLRDLYDASTPAVERAVEKVNAHGALGARMMGGGFGGHVLALLPPAISPPADATVVRPMQGARILG